MQSFHLSVLPALLLGAVLTLPAAPALASTVIDQNQPINTTTVSYLSSGSSQSFQQTANNVAGAGIYLDAGYGSGSERIRGCPASANPHPADVRRNLSGRGQAA
jgi:hypothetical protein